MSDYNYDINDIIGVMKLKDAEDFEWFDEELAVAHMLISGQLYLNSRRYLEHDWGSNSTPSQSYTSVVFVSCNDVFAWACADGEPLPYTEIKDLFMLWHEDKTWGAVKWVCIKRNMQPQKPVANAMKKESKWCSVMESLPKNKYD